MSGPTKCIHMTIEEMKKESEDTYNLGFKHGVDMMLKLIRTMPGGLSPPQFETLSVAACTNALYKKGKVVENSAKAWAERKEKEFGYER